MDRGVLSEGFNRLINWAKNDSGFITSEIDSMGTGWARFKSGLQICYGNATNTNALATGTTRFSFPKIFNIVPSVITTPNLKAPYGCTAYVEGASTWVLTVYNAVNGVLQTTPDPLRCSYVAIGTWK